MPRQGASAAARTDRETGQDGPLGRALRGARAGDESGFLTLWRELQPPLLRYLRLKSGDACEDVAAEVWLQVVRDLRKFRGDVDDFRAWLFTVARNRAIDHARATAARPSLASDDPAALIDARSALSVPSAETVAIEAISTRAALALVATLPADQAELVALRVVAGLDVERVAGIVGRSSGAVRVAVHRALRTLAERAGGLQDGDEHDEPMEVM